MLRHDANDADDAIALDDLAFITNALHACTDFHGEFLGAARTFADEKDTWPHAGRLLDQTQREIIPSGFDRIKACEGSAQRYRKTILPLVRS